MPVTPEQLRSHPRHPIAVVCRRTGLKPDLLRAWERRYHAIEPSRNDSQRRLYSDVDVERLQLLKRAVDAGRSISLLSQLDTRQIEELLRADLDARRRDGAVVPVEPVRPPSAILLDGCLEAALTLDTATLAYELERGGQLLGLRSLTLDVIAPLMRTLGAHWKQGMVGPVHEHAATAVVRSLLGRMLTLSPIVGRPPVVASTLPGEQHELGALLAAAIAASEGWSVVYLGPNLPPADIAAAASAASARVAMISLVRGAPAATARELTALAGALPVSTTLVTGGPATQQHAPLIRRLGGEVVDDLADLPGLLAALV